MNTPIWKIEWNDAMSVGIPEIDEDEKRFLLMVEEFNRAIVDRKDISEIRMRLQNIVEDREEHFANEENLLHEMRYPHIDDHALKHVELKNLILQTLKDSTSYGQNADKQWIEAGLDIKEALLKHILKEDKKYADYYHNSRIPRTNTQ